jgi:hypothetical protein
MKLIDLRYRSLSLLIALMTFSGLILPQSGWATEKQVSTSAAQVIVDRVTGASSNMQLSQAEESLSLISAGYDKALKNALNNLKLKAKAEQAIRENSRPEVLVPLFSKELRRVARENKTTLPKLLEQFPRAQVEAAGSGIGGKVTVNGAALPSEISVVAFDEYGYFAGEAKAAKDNGNYTITGLNGGSYFVATFSQEYVDEIYDNVEAPLSSLDTWRNAQKIGVAEGAITEGINFDLQSGARISGTLFQPDGTTLVSDEEATFVVTNANSSVPLLQSTVSLTDGRFDLVIARKGDLKISATVNGYMTTWHPNQTDWALAQTVNIPDYNATVNNINFTLIPDPTAPPHGIISVTMKPEDFFFTITGIVLAFDAVDTTLAGIDLILFGGSYKKLNLPVGNYFVYGDDIAGNLLGSGNYVGEFYDNAHSSDGAKLVPVLADQETHIDFVLERGGAISGKLTDSQGVALDSMIVLAIGNAVFEDGLDPFFNNIQIAACISDAEGRYRMEGLPTGDYTLRTLSDYILMFDISKGSLDSIIVIKPGKHAGQVVDEYYKGVSNLLRFQEATPVPVTAPAETENIDFQLQPAGFITGKITDAVTNAPVTRIMIAALDDTSGYPFIPLGKIDSVGQYAIGPLPFGKYKVLALSGFQRNVNYLSEFYDGARDFNSALVINLNSAEYPNANFTLDEGATIHGFIDLAEGGAQYYAGADTLEGFPVVAFDAATGKTASYGFVQFNGGYKIDKLLPGSYKVLALPINPPFAATYWGGGNDFNDPAGQLVTLNFGETADCTIELEKASASIAGQVFDANTNAKLSQIMVVAYDATGHPVGLAMSDTDLFTGLTLTQNGVYQINGLRPGQYYLRTLALSSLLSVVDTVEGLIGMFSDLDLTQLLSSGLPSFDFSFSLYQDDWYTSIPASIDINVNELIFQAASFGLADAHENAFVPFYLPMPFYSAVPVGASAINVVEGGMMTGIDFRLLPGGLDDIFTDVDPRAGGDEALPDKFTVRQNYPNPFNPSTTLTLDLPATARVSVQVFDALGRQVITLMNGDLPLGEHKLVWNGTDASGREVPAGIYLARINTSGYSRMVKMLLVK